MGLSSDVLSGCPTLRALAQTRFSPPPPEGCGATPRRGAALRTPLRLLRRLRCRNRCCHLRCRSHPLSAYFYCTYQVGAIEELAPLSRLVVPVVR
mmetsp:Transcript_14069/g.21041  ORF Transcript_14069/g.21041 Transcript_14069/m.21041 type:complete len:95 (-) Transcript_14069:87-371(-)